MLACRRRCTARRRRLRTAGPTIIFRSSTMGPLEKEKSRFWENHGDFNDVDTKSIQTEVFQFPATCFAEEEGSLTNSGRWLQWHWPGGTPPGEAKHDNWIMGQIFVRLRELYRKEGGAFPDPIRNL